MGLVWDILDALAKLADETNKSAEKAKMLSDSQLEKQMRNSYSLGKQMGAMKEYKERHSSKS